MSNVRKRVSRMSLMATEDDEDPEQAKKDGKRAGAIFADSEAMKEKLHQSLAKPSYDVTNFYHDKGLWQLVARHRVFEQLTLGVISLNAFYISVDTDHNKASVLTDAAWGFQMMEHFFCVYFSLEWFIRFKAFARKHDGLRDAWFVFDSSMVAMMVGETWIVTLVLAFFGVGGDGDGSMGNAGIMRLLRLLRLSRMARMARLLKAMPELLILIKGMGAAMRSVFFTLVLQLLLMYIFGVTFKLLTEGSPIGHQWFSNVPHSMHTLLVKGTLLDNFGELDKALGATSFMFLIVYYVFILLSALTVSNMLIGVLCEVISAVASVEHETLRVTYVKGRLQEILRAGGLDTDGDGMISKVEFASLLDNIEAARILSEVGVDVFALVELADFIFEDENERDDHGKPKERLLTFGDFMELVLKLRGSNNSTVKDIVDLRKSTIARASSLEKAMQQAEQRITEAFRSFLEHREEILSRLRHAGGAATWNGADVREPASLARPSAQEAPQAKWEVFAAELPDALHLPIQPQLADDLWQSTSHGTPDESPASAREHLRPEMERLEKLRRHVNTETLRLCEDLHNAECAAASAGMHPLPPSSSSVSPSFTHAAARATSAATACEQSVWADASASAIAELQMETKDLASAAEVAQESDGVADKFGQSKQPRSRVPADASHAQTASMSNAAAACGGSGLQTVAASAGASAAAGGAADAGGSVRLKATVNVSLEVIAN